MVKTLPAAVGISEQFPQSVVEITTDASTRKPGRLGFQIEHLTNLATFPVEPWITPGAIRHGTLHPCQHGQGDTAVGGNVLAAAEKPRQTTRIAFEQTIQRQLLVHPLPQVILA